MSRWYVHTSAALKLIVEEAESSALAAAVDTFDGDLAGCWLLETELRRAAQRTEGLEQSAVSQFLDAIDLYAVPSSVFREAGLLPGTSLRSLDALHLAVAVRLGVDAVVTYDNRMQDCCVSLGLAVLAPTAA
ncbi:type II toxin-antitoxin system VapC family toxin [Aeromicrobium sp. CTD01-1L150]|uniref:type II toxin-antitoxin system VapC family toxin n=1 Tax=Aeromicrobium sp. CTD01-1L150 TaxID=3341830 RepID=UPI0035BECA76